jgi:hypothetical protein
MSFNLIKCHKRVFQTRISIYCNGLLFNITLLVIILHIMFGAFIEDSLIFDIDIFMYHVINLIM